MSSMRKPEVLGLGIGDLRLVVARLLVGARGDGDRARTLVEHGL
jgi:hypothetical protein